MHRKTRGDLTLRIHTGFQTSENVGLSVAGGYRRTYEFDDDVDDDQPAMQVVRN